MTEERKRPDLDDAVRLLNVGNLALMLRDFWKLLRSAWPSKPKTDNRDDGQAS
ncbi:hypothetical protein SAMN05216358_4635 [Rhizobium sp. AN5]|uniref:hypothetical protein n=1 Tax=Rhizobium sp. AN5 TaxID=1855304 RepID=UPI000BCEE506|nr:hypothetical protein [Rhizobium sp. AN5]SOC94426.1 hypothetical protein SAMN05216358_4635 [Rhizobium sp. AN5]